MPRSLKTKEQNLKTKKQQLRSRINSVVIEIEIEKQRWVLGYGPKSNTQKHNDFLQEKFVELGRLRLKQLELEEKLKSKKSRARWNEAYIPGAFAPLAKAAYGLKNTRLNELTHEERLQIKMLTLYATAALGLIWYNNYMLTPNKKNRKPYSVHDNNRDKWLDQYHPRRFEIFSWHRAGPPPPIAFLQNGRPDINHPYWAARDEYRRQSGSGYPDKKVTPKKKSS